MLFGPPGAGKGTQGEFLAKSGFIKLSPGDLIRQEIQKKTLLGKKLQDILNQGSLVESSLIYELLGNINTQKHAYVFDGFPRNKEQLDFFHSMLMKESKYIVIHLALSKEIIKQRLNSRLVCSQCGLVYNNFFNHPIKENVCDKCEGVLIKRSDDQSSIIDQRVAIYEQETIPLIKLCKEKKIQVYDVDAVLSIEEIKKEIERIVISLEK